MDIIKNTIEFNIPDNTVVTIGKFDGIHKGHILILDKMKEYRVLGYKVCVLTFDRPPAALGFPGDKEVLMSMKDKEIAFEALGIDYLIEFPFYEKTASISANDFIEEFIVDRLHAKAIVVGEDCSFGKGAKGNAQMLLDYGPRYGFEVKIMQKLLDGDREISSSYLRELLRDGNVIKVDELSYRPSYTKGQFRVGPSKISKALTGYFLDISKEKLLPKPGTYYSLVMYNDSPYIALTFVSGDSREIETYLYNDVKGIGSNESTLLLLERIGDEFKSESKTELNEMVRKAIFEGQKWHKEHFNYYAERFSRVDC